MYLSYLKIVFTMENNLAEINQINFILSAEFIFTDSFKKGVNTPVRF